MSDYEDKISAVIQRRAIGLRGNTIETHVRDRYDMANGAEGLLDQQYRAAGVAEPYELVHAFDYIVTELIRKPPYRYSLDRAKLTEMGVTPSDDNVIRLRNTIRDTLREMSKRRDDSPDKDLGTLSDLINPGTGLYVYYDKTNAAKPFAISLDKVPSEPHFRITSGYILDFAFVDGSTLGGKKATEGMDAAIQGEYEKFRPLHRSKGVSDICNSCMAGNQMKEGLAYCYLAGIAKGDFNHEQFLKSKAGKQSIDNDPIAKAATQRTAMR